MIRFAESTHKENGTTTTDDTIYKDASSVRSTTTGREATPLFSLLMVNNVLGAEDCAMIGGGFGATACAETTVVAGGGFRS